MEIPFDQNILSIVWNRTKRECDNAW